MANPWTKKNPLMSLWLSGANALAGKARSAARGAGKAEASRQQTSLTKQAARFWGSAWVAATKPSSKPKRRR